MKNKKLSVILLMIILSILCSAIVPSIAFASTDIELYLGILEYRTGTDPENMGYAILNPEADEATGTKGMKIWDIVKYSSETDNIADTTPNYYCVKAGVGFSDEKMTQTYNKAYNFRTEKDDVSAIINITEENYYNLLALADLLYLNGISTDEEKAALKTSAGVGISEYGFQYDLTDSDIETIQQAAIWYFTNGEDDLYDNTKRTNWLFYRTEDMEKSNESYTTLSDYEKNPDKASYGKGYQRNEQSNILYNYLIDTAKNNASSYKDGKVIPATKITLYANTQVEDEQPVVLIEKEKRTFDLKLIKRITEVNGVAIERIEADPDISKLADGTETTADYKLNKNPVPVKTGDIVKYTFRIYNEGEIDGYAAEITEDIPAGLEFIWSELTEEELKASTEYTDAEKQAIRENRNMYWAFAENSIDKISTDYLAKGQGKELEEDGVNLIKAFNSENEYANNVNERNPDYKEVSVYLKVTSTEATGTIIRNESAITKSTDKNGSVVIDRDSDTALWGKENSDKYYDLDKKWSIYKEDDEDYDNIILKQFDLALRKFIIAISNDKTVNDKDYLKNANGTYTRVPQVDTTKLNTTDGEGKIITTAIYNHSKKPLEVNKGDYVVYMLRTYNEGDIAGYATEITDYLPEYLEFVDGEFNNKYGWKVSSNGRSIKTNYLQNSLIDEAEKTEEGYRLSYVEVPVMCRVKNSAKYNENITNIAEITISKDEDKKSITDRDSITDNVKLPEDTKLSSYKNNENGSYVPGQQDDDDFEKVIVKQFDLALRKFIAKINDTEVTNRFPQVSYDKENNKITYTHTKEPVEVVSTDIVTYIIRVYNEGEVAGYASKITDDLPEGLEYLPEDELNKEYRWVMYDEEGKVTDDVTKAVKITTDYLSKEQGEARMKLDKTLTKNPALLDTFDSNKEIAETNPDYADVKVRFKVVEPNTSDKIVINSAQISDDTDKNGNDIDDVDSTPDQWIDGEDDQDKEYIKLTYFDLALRKWVTQAIVIEDGKEVVTQTGHKAEDDPEEVVKVEIHRKKINSVTVKFRYSIRITNEGDIAGYAKEITDYVPEGLKFVAEDNPGWTDEGNNVISTKLLETTLLQPGECAEVEVLLTWINGNDNLGLKDNWAEISEHYNDKNVPDRDSTPDNQVKDEDDIDNAEVILSVSTGQTRIYFTLGFIVLITLASGIIIIKKFIL